ncbi:MAG: hypothetical protein H0X25_10045 [Acidobacteriales bacterium]|nr:hypothetical protein [Terriglobales bacterium]
MMKSRGIALILSAVALAAVAQFVRTPSLALAAGESGATVHGTVKFQGTAPKEMPIDMSADPYCAKANPSAKTMDVIVDTGGGLENAVVYISAGVSGQTFAPPLEPAVISQKGCMYQPHVIAMQTNQKLNIINDDKTSHNIHPAPVNNREWNKSQPPGVAMDGTFSREEVAVPVKCNIHPWMKSYIAVVKNPYFATSGKGGEFDLKGLPPGTYTVTVWHEKLGTKSQSITIPGAESKSLDFVFNQ